MDIHHKADFATAKSEIYRTREATSAKDTESTKLETKIYHRFRCVFAVNILSLLPFRVP